MRGTYLYPRQGTVATVATMRYQVSPGFDGTLIAGGHTHDLLLRFAAGMWHARIVSFDSDTIKDPWSAASPDLAHLLTTGLAMLRTFDTDGIR